MGNKRREIRLLNGVQYVGNIDPNVKFTNIIATQRYDYTESKSFPSKQWYSLPLVD